MQVIKYEGIENITKLGGNDYINKNAIRCFIDIVNNNDMQAFSTYLASIYYNGDFEKLMGVFMDLETHAAAYGKDTTTLLLNAFINEISNK